MSAKVKETAKKAKTVTKSSLETFEEPNNTLLSLIKIYREDRDAFFALANNFSDKPNSKEEPLSGLAVKIKRIVRSGFSVDEGVNGHVIISGGSQQLKVPKSVKQNILNFLDDLNGIAKGNDKRNYYGEKVSDSELAFKLGLDNEELCGSVKKNIDKWMSSSPTVLTIADDDLKSVKTRMPKYAVFNLMYCATKVVQNPTVVFEGIRLEGRLKKGFAYCGVPRFTYNNKGDRSPRPKNKVFLVFADPKNHIFAWDWVKEDTENKTYPCGWKRRFGKKIDLSNEVVLTGVDDVKPSRTFSKKPWYSSHGDCIFSYRTDEPAYAERINDELTIFISFEKKETVGLKLKNVSSIMNRFRQEFVSMLHSKAKIKPILANSYMQRVEKGASDEEHKVYKDLIHFAENHSVDAAFNILGLNTKIEAMT